MALVDMRDMLRHAYEHSYAVAAFEVLSCDVLAAVLQAAQECRAPVVLTVRMGSDAPQEVGLLMPAVEAAARRSPVPVAIQGLGVSSEEVLRLAVALGCNGVAIPCATGLLPDAIRRLRELADAARSCGVAVEGGWLGETDGTAEPCWPTPAEATALAQRSVLDCLALDGVAKKHHATLDLARLRQINSSVSGPLAWHRSAALSEDQIRRAIFKGVSKMGVDIDLTLMAQQALTHTQSQPGESFAGTLQAQIRTEAERHMRLLGSAGRAAEVQARCTPWEMAQQVWLSNDGSVSEQEFLRVVGELRRLAGEKPGVRGLLAGKALSDQGKHRFCLVLRVSHPVVLTQGPLANAALPALGSPSRSRGTPAGFEAYETQEVGM